ncbi:ubiquitin-specific protease doa4 [Lobosporangium transversale]|uniref:ubiquitinyl hydrolase 1 n=1 Tax=Lobosporangium transversale TaxID=64571 RepID=A0A1Y2GQ69_9FUNG|nr:hypothetical protein BCR41DRAFT_352364 [Lobosporangium transversale]KAF9914328.1 ubiquitin-specific protease doa4 [Lobosporangium transversale]ORZ18421.1 hypothetical protein BCR41DRAFT_352364 [Lobosporangium transversale]|eukprot:XP_021882216.1 hypothetical protein BCR41DRAFT_352364 [Lobosporangium transversale]
MLPITANSSTTTTTATVLDSPQKKIRDLVVAAKVDRDPSISPKQYVRSAEKILNSAHFARVRGDMEEAFVLYVKASTIVLEVVTHDKDFEKYKTDQEYVAIKKRIVELFSDTEKIKDLLMAKYESIQDVEANALVAAAKAGRPKPPPRPNKPDFLSSSRYDGQAPIPSASPRIHSSSAPTPGALSVSHPSTTSQQPILSSGSNVMAGIQAPITSMSMSLPNGMTSAPLSTTLASYKPLMPTVNSSPSTSPVVVPTMVSSTGSTGNSGSTAYPAYPASTSALSGSSYSSQLSSSPIPMPRPVHTITSPASAPTPAAITNGKINEVGMSLDNTPPSTNKVQPNSATSNGSKTEEYKYPLSIKPQRLLEYMRQPNPPALLLIDVRMQVQYVNASIKAPSVINIEPPALRDGVSAKILYEQGLFNNPPDERALFAERAKFALVIYYDQSSMEIPTSGPLCNLCRALVDLEFGTPLQKRPVLLVGGFNAWLDCAGMNWVKGTGVDAAKRIGQTPPPISDSSDVSSINSRESLQNQPGLQPQSHALFAKLSQGGGINRHDGRIIRRTIGEYIKRDDGPQSMVNPRIGSNPSNLSNPAYPPQATPYSSVNASYSPPPSSLNSIPPTSGSHGATISNQPNGIHNIYDLRAQDMGQQLGGMRQRDKSAAGLQRRLTIYDNHWNNFGASEKPHSGNPMLPPIPDKIPISGTSILGPPSTDSNTPSGPGLPAPAPNGATRPPIPVKPMRPLPQPPGMNDLKDYTKFGSGFSKIGGSQLGKTGLTNLGNTCFMNSVIQCLIATPPLSRYFLDGSFKRNINIKNPLGTQGKLAEAFYDLISSMWSGQSLVVSPTSFRLAIGGFAPQFKGTEQHDSQEFLSFLLDGLHEDLKAEPRPPPPGDDEGSEADDARMESLPEYEASDIAWQRYLRRDNSIVVKLFQGQFKNRLCCTKCGKTSTTYNAFMYLALPIKAKTTGRQPQTLMSCLNTFVEAEVMDGDNAWNCPNCKKPRKATKQLTISRVPDVLLIQLKRFSSDGPFKNKIKTMVQYPIQDLDLTPYLPKRPSANGLVSEPAIYDLYAVSNHSGEVSSGHYTACVRGETPNSWINFDDSRVSPCDKSVAVSEHGYTLFYVRKK